MSKTSVEGLPDQGNNGESGSVIRKEQARRYLSSDVEEHELEGFGAHLASALSGIEPRLLARFDPTQEPHLLLLDSFRTVLTVKSSLRSRLRRALDCSGPF